MTGRRRLREATVVVEASRGRHARETPWAYGGDVTEARISPTVVLERVTQRYGVTTALDRVSATIAPGTFVAVIGRSGAGKTTLLRALARAITPSEGAIRFGAQDLANLRGAALRAHRARVGVIYQQFNLVRRLRVIDNVLVGRLGRLHGCRRLTALARQFGAADQRVAYRCLDHVGLLDRIWQRTDTLSGGEQQRVAIARILAQEPTLVLGDEPVASLDPMNGALVMTTLRDVATRAGLTVIATLHHVDYARRYADRILGLRDGRLVFDGSAAALTDGALVEIFGETPAAVTPSPALTPPLSEWLPSVAS
jgi:phosphonate transport system ATP-binding protein